VGFVERRRNEPHGELRGGPGIHPLDYQLGFEVLPDTETEELTAISLQHDPRNPHKSHGVDTY
jgi:hypothetical protein